jgi:SAM-dependent methyltransferase
MDRIVTGPVVYEDIQIPVPDAEEVELTLNFGAGKLELQGGAKDALVSGEAAYNVADFKPRFSIEGNHVKLETGDLEINGIPRLSDEVRNEWDLKLGETPLLLTINAGAYQGDFDLGGAILARMPKNATAADLGCGTGELLARLASKAMKAIGVDNSPRMLEIAAKRFRGNNAVSLRIGELTHLPLRDWEADFAVLSMVLHHLDQPAQALTEAARVLKFDGRLLVADFDEHAEEDMRASYGDHRLGFSRETMLQWLAQARFEVRSVERFPVNRGLAVMLYEAVKK